MSQLAVPLAGHAILQTENIDEARASIGASLAPHSLTPIGATHAFHARHNVVELGQLSLHYIDYGSDVEVGVQDMGFGLVQIPMTGMCTVTSATAQCLGTQRTAVMTAAGASVRMRYPEGNPRLMVRIAPDRLRERCDLAGVELPPGDVHNFDVSTGPGRTWRQLLQVVLSDLSGDAGVTASPLAAKSIEVALVDGLVACLTSPADPTGSGLDRAVRRAAHLIEDHCDEALATADVAEAVGLTVRQLRNGFQQSFDTTPMAYLRQARLQQLHSTLLSGDCTSVTEEALRWGFTHLGRLGGEYRAVFGETPSETLRRAK